jgi:hypothetical protein
MGNLNLGTVECEECGNTFTCRVGLSNRRVQVLSITCKECGAVSSIEVSETQNIKVSGIKQSSNEPQYHIDLHLDFPVFEHEQHPLISPFMMSTMMGGSLNTSKHANDMHLLNKIADNIIEIKNTLNFYLRKKYKIFSRKVSLYLGIEEINPNKIQAEMLLFKYLFEIIEPFNDLDSTNKSIDLFLEKFKNLKNTSENELNAFIKEIKKSKFIDIGIDDSVKIYKQILLKEVIFIPSLFIEYIKDRDNNKTPFLLSTKDFEYISDLFKDISEVLSRQLVIVAGINNLLKRNNHNEFKVVLSKKNKNLEPKSLKDYANLDFGRKLEFIDASWFPISTKIADNQLRNSTAHYKWEYDSATQVIKYFPKKEGLERSASNELYLIEYCKKIIESFRVFHELNFLFHTMNLKVYEKI